MVDLEFRILIMPVDSNFEKQWLIKLHTALKRIGKDDLFSDVIIDKNKISLITWIQKLMKILNNSFSKEEIISVMTSCACLTPKENLKPLCEEYAKTKDLKKVHTILQEVFEKFIKKYKNLNEEQMEFLRKNGWGMAGRLEGNTIYATKIPKEIHKYFQTPDEQKKKYYYCHCPRIRDLFLSNEETLDMNYCFCGAGFYKDIWEYILKREVKVEIIESVMKDDEVCKVAIHI